MVDVLRHIKTAVYILFLILLIYGSYKAEARGGRGGGRGKSRGRGNKVSAKTKTAVSKYKGPTYKKGSWKTSQAAGSLYGIAYYQRTQMYKDHPDREPTVCFNAIKPRGSKKWAYFICPEPGQKDEMNKCCGEEGAQTCCVTENEFGLPGVFGIIFGDIAGIFIIFLGCYCYCKSHGCSCERMCNCCEGFCKDICANVNCTKQTPKKDSDKDGTKTAEHELQSLTDSTTNGVPVVNQPETIQSSGESESHLTSVTTQ